MEFTTFNLDAEGMLGNEDGIWRFTEIKLRPVVTVLKEEDNDLAIRLLEKAKKSCLIARSLQCEVALCADQGRIVRASNSFKQFATTKQSAIVDYTSEAATITATSESQFSRQDRPRSVTSGGSSDR